jgi:hypothetical protein
MKRQQVVPNGPVIVIASLLKKFGVRIPGGGYEVTLSNDEINAITTTGKIEEAADPEKKHVKLQYFPNIIIEGQGTFVDDRPTQSPSGENEQLVSGGVDSVRDSGSEQASGADSGEAGGIPERPEGERGDADSSEPAASEPPAEPV